MFDLTHMGLLTGINPPSPQPFNSPPFCGADSKPQVNELATSSLLHVLLYQFELGFIYSLIYEV